VPAATKHGTRRVRTAFVIATLLVLACGGGLWATQSSASRSGSSSATSRRSSPAPAAVRTATPPPAVDLPRGAARPNVMVVMMDDMRWDEVKYMPNVERYVKDRGLRFTNSFSPYPLCCPARSSFLLGEYSHNHHVLYHDAPYGFGAIDDSSTIAGALQKVGYRTALVGKYLNKYGVQPSKVTGRSSVHYVPAGWTDWMAGLDTDWPVGSPYAGNTYDYFSFTQNINGRTVPHHGAYSSSVVAGEVESLLGKYAAAPVAKPWFMWVTPVAPHFGGPVEADDPPDYTEADGRVQEFATPGRPDWVKGRFDAEISHAPGTRVHGPSEADVSDKPHNIAKFLETTPEENLRLRDTQRQRAESLYAFDVEFGRIVARLKATGQYDRTLIMFTSDNGYYTGEHRQRLGKIKPHEPVIHVPLIVAGPGVQHGVRYAPVTTFDLTSTILDIAGGTLASADGHGLDGESKASVIYGPDRGWTYPMLTEGLLKDVKVKVAGFTRGGLTEIGIRTGRWKYVRYGNGDQELYDLDTDPLELASKIGDPAYAQVQRDLTAMWWAYKDCQGAACRAPLPAKYQSSVRDLARQSIHASRAVHAYYDN
jgi:N-acetylglucosamine-6-sulfatase